MYHKLLLIVGDHGAGKTAFLQAVLDGKSTISGPARTIFDLSIANRSAGKEAIVQTVWKEDAEAEFAAFLRQSFTAGEQRHIARHIHCLADLYRPGMHQAMGIQRWILLKLLVRISKDLPCLVVIDEPELFMHPFLIRECCVLLRQMQQQNGAVIVASNSQQVISDLFEDIEQVVRLEPDGIVQADAEAIAQQIQAFYHQDDMLLRRFSQAGQKDAGMINVVSHYTRSYLSSVFKDHIFNVMFSRCIILGEGSSEGVLFDYMEHAIHAAWTREERVNYMSCLGKGTMPFYFIFLNAIGVRCICMYDYDNDTNPVHTAYAKAFMRYEQAHPDQFMKFALQPDLEGVLRIDPPYKLMAVEKPVHVFQCSFVTNQVKAKVEELLGVLESMVRRMNDKEAFERES